MTLIQLTITQATILSAACARDDGLVFPVTASIKGGPVGNSLKSLLKRGLIEEIKASNLNTVWRHDEAGSLTLRTTPLAYSALGGLKPETVKRLEALGEQLDGGNITKRRIRADLMPIVGTRLIREWQGVEHLVTVTSGGFDWQGRPYQSLSSVARAITGTRWNGWVFFGLKNHRRGA